MRRDILLENLVPKFINNKHHSILINHNTPMENALWLIFRKIKLAVVL